MSEPQSQPQPDGATLSTDDDAADIALFDRLADRYADREEGRAFALAAQSLREDK